LNISFFGSGNSSLPSGFFVILKYGARGRFEKLAEEVSSSGNKFRVVHKLAR
jgi:hypothetical protein